MVNNDSKVKISIWQILLLLLEQATLARYLSSGNKTGRRLPTKSDKKSWTDGRLKRIKN